MKNVGIAQLKAHLSEYLRLTQQGEVLTVCDRDRPLARIVPLDRPAGGLITRKPRLQLGDVTFPPPVKGVDSLPLLLEDRRDRR